MDVGTIINRMENELKNLKSITKSRERFEMAAGKWADVDTKKFLREIYDSRDFSTRKQVESFYGKKL